MKLFINENCTVMKKNTMKTNIKQIRTISSRMPKTINEAINFNEDDDMDMPEEGPEEELPAESPVAKDTHNIDNFISNMRKESLGIMKALADNPDDSVYQFAKKIFQLADKAHEDQKEGKDINGQPKQQMSNSQQRPM